ncbi:trypsin-like serine protease [Alteromonas sp. ASW11-130]|uniref:trypsin-like serine protease n=1 Tax=Alteromonas sp. ASW11-130 TaxID=3015775 RepID=UPI00224195A4|nr:trypsin-like serine protease [Alteromonas sp. ASW11-130]MCW8093086.1 trypsin-like serine protease [Alteromonas sp. ASW11-130]
MKFLLFFIFAFCSVATNAVVVRHDIPVDDYHVDNMPEYVIELPHEGLGVLIDSQWVVTVAHTVFYDYTGLKLNIGAEFYGIEEVKLHPHYKRPNKDLLSGDLAPLMRLLKSSSDIALIKLSKPVLGVHPISLYANSDEKGEVITVFGNGATGNGLLGEDLNTKSLHQARKFQNIVESAEGNWLTFKFDLPASALPLEGMQGSGDSGGASIIYHDGIPFLVGLSSWQLATGDISNFKGGLYGTTAYQTRISSYYDWIMSIVGS